MPYGFDQVVSCWQELTTMKTSTKDDTLLSAHKSKTTADTIKAQ